MKKISFVGQIVGKYSRAEYVAGQKTDKQKRYIQLLDTEKDDFGNVRASLTNVKVSEETYPSIEINSVIEIDVKEYVADDGKVYFTELDK